MKRAGKLGSIHYDERLICDLWKEISEFANATSSEFSVDHESSSTEFETPEELLNATQIPNRITKFELSLEASEGNLRISASPYGHKYMIRGEEDWVRQMSDYIRDFGSEHENKIRTKLTNNRISLLQLIVGGGLISSSWNKIISFLLPFYHVELPQTDWYIFIGLVMAIILLQISKYIYPTVEFRRRGSETRVRKTTFLLMLLGSIASTLQAVYWIL